MPQKIVLNKTVKMSLRPDATKTYIKRSCHQAAELEEGNLQGKKAPDQKCDSPKYKQVKLTRKSLTKGTKLTRRSPRTTQASRTQLSATCSSTDSIIYLGTLYKFRGYSVSDTEPPVIDLTDSTTELNSKSDYVLPDLESSKLSVTGGSSTSVQTVASTQVPSSEEASGEEQREVLDAYKCTTCNDSLADLSFNSEETERMRKASQTRLQTPEEVKSFEEKTSLNQEDLEILNGILNAEEECNAGTKDFNSQTDFISVSNLEALDSNTLLEDMNVSLTTLLETYDVNNKE